MGRLDRLQRVLAKEDVRAISRRYFIANGFDGTLTSIGVVVGAYLSGIGDGVTAIMIGLGAAVGLGTSGVWSVWEIERAQAMAEQERIERAMLTELEDTRLQRENRAAQIVHATASATRYPTSPSRASRKHSSDSRHLRAKTATENSLEANRLGHGVDLDDAPDWNRRCRPRVSEIDVEHERCVGIVPLVHAFDCLALLVSIRLTTLRLAILEM